MITINPNGIWSPRGRGFSMGVLQPIGQVIHFTGQVAWDEDENIVGPGDVSAQTRQAFLNIETLLAAVGGTLADLISVTTYFIDRDHLPMIQKVRAEMLDPAAPPASTSVMVAGLGDPAFLVKLAPIAVIPEDRFVRP